MQTKTRGHIAELRQIWTDAYPSAAPRKRMLIEKLLTTPLLLIRMLSFDQIGSMLGDGSKHVFMDLYVLFFSALLATILALPSHLGLLGLVIVIYRLIDLVTYRVYFLLVKSETRPWTPALLRRSFVIVLVNFCESVVAYAVIYSSLAHILPTNPAWPAAMTTVTSLYYSAVTAVTVGYGDYVPVDDFSRLIVVSQLACTVLFLIFIIPALVSLFATNHDA